MRQFKILGFSLLIFSLALTARAATNGSKRNNQQVGRTVAADPQVTVSVCLVSGNITVRGWERNEVRARITDGVQIELTRIDQGSSQPATELRLTSEGGMNRRGNCLPNGNLQLDVPRAASLKLQTTNGDITVTDAARVNATSQSGGISMTRLRGEANAGTISGEISVTTSVGGFKLHSVSGAIEARDLSPASAGDAFNSTTVSGEITVNQITNQQVKINTVSGDISYSGGLLRGGHYSFQNMSGEMLLSLPANASFRLSANVGPDATLNSDFDLNQQRRNLDAAPDHAMRHIEAIVGGGDASVSVSLFGGSLRIRKR